VCSDDAVVVAAADAHVVAVAVADAHVVAVAVAAAVAVAVAETGLNQIFRVFVRRSGHVHVICEVG